ncbi:MAG: hypothetical protein KF851_03180 [Pirellulaceae bacterium]|nr:hypothetical protein [Pirellulaceae bacterium]
MNSGQTGREVVVRFKLAADNSNKSAANEVIKEAERSQKRLSEIDKQRASEAVKAERIRQSAAEKAIKEIERQEDRAHDRHRQRQRSIAAENRKQREQDAKETAAAQRRADLEADRLHRRHRERQRSIASQNRKQREDEVRETEKAAAAAEAAWTRANTASYNAQVKLNNAIMSGGRAAVQVARSIALIGIASEKDMEKAIRAFAKIEAGIQIVSAIANAVKAGTQAWRAYQTAVLAAAAAQQAASMAGGGIGPGGAMRGAAGRAAAGGAGRAAAGGVLGALGMGASAAAMGKGALFAAGGAGLLAGGALAGESLYNAATGRTQNNSADFLSNAMIGAAHYFPRGAETIFGSAGDAFGGWYMEPYRNAADSKEKARKQNEARLRKLGAMEQQEQFQSRALQQSAVANFASGDIAGTNARRGLTGGAADRAEAEARLKEMRQRQTSTMGQAGIAGREGEAISQARLAFAQEELQLQAQLRDAKMTQHREEISAIDKNISALQKAQAEADRLYDKETSRLQTAEQRLSAMDAAEVAALRNSLKTAQSGGTLGRDQLDLIRSVGLYDDEVEEQQRKRITQLGVDDLLAPVRQRQADAKAEQDRLKVELQTELSARVKLEADTDELAQKFAEELQPFLLEVRERQIEALEAAMERQRRNSAMTQKQGEQQ